MNPWRRRAPAPLTGWVSYHGTASVCGVPGLAMTFRHAFGPIKLMAIMDREVHGKVAYETRLDSHKDVLPAIEAAGRHALRVPHERPIFEAMLPGPEPDLRENLGLPPHAAQRDAARSAIACEPMPDAMRDALTACLDHGIPDCLDTLAKARRDSPTREWATLALAARIPLVVEGTLDRGARPIALGADPLATMRVAWPRMAEAHLRRLRGMAPAERRAMTEAAQDAMPCVADLLFDLPPDWMPEGEDGWKAFAKVAHAVAELALSVRGAVARRDLVRSSKGDWPSFLARLSSGTHGPRGDGPSVPDAARNALDASGSLCQQVVIPLAARAAEARGLPLRQGDYLRKAAIALLYGGKGLASVLETSRAWHARSHAINALVRSGTGTPAWAPLFEGAFRDGPTEIVAVAERLSLTEEGACGPDRHGVPGLDHCVASREHLYMAGKAHVLSVRRRSSDGTWRRLSTCQVETSSWGGKVMLAVMEHRGRRNADPPAEAVIAVGLLCRAIREGAVVPVPEALVPRDPPPTARFGPSCGYDIANDAAVARAVLAWEPLLPRWARGLGPDGLFAEMGARGILGPVTLES